VVNLSYEVIKITANIILQCRPESCVSYKGHLNMDIILEETWA